jgi:hypothetical protein
LPEWEAATVKNPLQEAVRIKAEEDGISLAQVEQELGLYDSKLHFFLIEGRCFNAAECRRVAHWLGWEVELVRFANELLRKETTAAREMEKAWNATLVDLNGISLPFFTTVGFVRRLPLNDPPHGCERCEMREACQKASDAGDFVFCERVLNMDLWPEQGGRDGCERVRLPEDTEAGTAVRAHRRPDPGTQQYGVHGALSSGWAGVRAPGHPVRG